VIKFKDYYQDYPDCDRYCGTGRGERNGCKECNCRKEECRCMGVDAGKECLCVSIGGVTNEILAIWYLVKVKNACNNNRKTYQAILLPKPEV
jgi:hypothetical protein